MYRVHLLQISILPYDVARMIHYIFKSYVASVKLLGSQGARGAGTGQRGLLAAEGRDRW